MAWFRNHYDCDRCGGSWSDEWSCTCDDDCPACGARHMSPTESEDLMAVVDARWGVFAVLESPPTAEHTPDYAMVAAFTTRAEAEAFARGGGSSV
jgi:hypothetical protein